MKRGGIGKMCQENYSVFTLGVFGSNTQEHALDLRDRVPLHTTSGYISGCH